MEGETEKVFVAVGNDVQDGFATLAWALRKWSSSQISIVILHADINKDYVYTYYGKLPASSVSDEKVDFLKKYEQGKVNKILHQYIAFCGKIKVETLNIEKYDEPIHKRIIELISGLRISNLVMGITFLKSTSWKYRNPLSELKHIQQKKPEFCELYLINGGKLCFLKEGNNEGFIQDDQGVMIAKPNKKRASLKGWLGKMFSENIKSPESSPSSTSTDSPLQWEKCAEDIEDYFKYLLSNADEEAEEVSNNILENRSSTEANLPKDLNPAAKTEFLKVKKGEARDVIELKRREAKGSVERYAKAEWAISLCTSRTEELETRLNEEITRRSDLEKNLEKVREEVSEIRIQVDQKKVNLDSTVEIQRELSNKLTSFSLAKPKLEGELEKMIHKRSIIIQEIDMLRKQRDIMERRIEFCKDKDAIEMATRLNDLSFGYKEFTPEEIQAGTEHFSERWRLKGSGDFTNVYRGRINHTTVAVKLYDSASQQVSKEDFHSKVKILSRIHHPHVVAMLGFCTELRCVVFEYMHEGCLRDALFCNNRRKQPLNWLDRVRVAAEVCSGLSFLHLAKPRPMIHGNLNLSKILLDRHNTIKLHGFRLDLSHDESDIKSDVEGFGSLVLQLLTGRSWSGFLHEVTMNNHVALAEVLDRAAGEWPLDVAMELARIAMRCSCSSMENKQGSYIGMAALMEEMEELRKTAEDLAADIQFPVETEGGVDADEVVPSFFFCPILQDVMKNPHVAADGSSYELEAIKQWLGMGHDTSPLTNLHLEHTRLTPNHTLRSLIQDWHDKRSLPLP